MALELQLTPKAQKSLDKLVARFQSGDIGEIRAIARIKLDPDAPANRWTIRNRLLAYLQSGELDCRTFLQWKAVGRKVTGSAVYILRPVTVLDQAHLEKTGEKRRFPVAFKGLAVHPVSVTEGEPLPSYEPSELPPLADVAKRLGVKVDYLPVPPDRLGDYTPGANRIRLGTESEEVFWHELAHAVHDQIDGLKGDKIHKETVAEFVAAVVADLYGYEDLSGSAWHYIKMFADEPLDAVLDSLDVISQVIAVITNEAEAIEAEA